MISVRGVSKLYGSTVALTDVSFDVGGGDRVALCGAPGSGKTTLLRLLGSWLEPSSGRIQICGFDSRTHLWRVRSRISFVASNAIVGTGLTVDEYLRFVARVRSRTAPSSRPAMPLEAAMAEAGLTAAARVDALSGERRAALVLAAALVAPSDVVLIDGALDQLEAGAREAVASRLLEAASRGTALVVATRDPDRHPGLFNRELRVKAGAISWSTQPGAEAKAN